MYDESFDDVYACVCVCHRSGEKILSMCSGGTEAGGGAVARGVLLGDDSAECDAEFDPDADSSPRSSDDWANMAEAASSVSCRGE